MNQLNSQVWYDKVLVSTVLILIAIGMIMVTSSSLYYAENGIKSGENHFVIRHLIYLLIACVSVSVVLTQPIERWQKYGPYLLVLGLFLLVLVLFAGRTVNGSRRWLAIGPLTFQVSEAIKLFVIVYLAGYLVRRTDELQTQIKGFAKPLLVLALITGLLLLEPDFGASVVILATSLAMLFLGGARLWQFIGLSGAVAGILGIIAVSQPYRMERLMTFLDPWADPFGSGYQLTQSLIAFGRGSLFGQGLGNSLQKLSYLPEAHTDFIFAVLAEELGLIGVAFVLCLFFVFFYRAMQIGRKALILDNPYAAYLAYGIGFCLTFQALINMGVTSGALPTKGLTLPFISYGGNSLIGCGTAVAILLRVDYENRLKEAGIVKQSPKKKDKGGKNK
ncbi:putative lipid II flippase FtsW [Aliikangiella marina]|uniref:Probable peptidoglycan glycosyltransferase FtsW n=1 Tax=Aliikangiella marina TaxID=1712262 RepID=A0A545TDL2_9GAMM|nr:putative lipid II flippase FtsW [Aliikangiella marina]TQV75281.1 putative lipid II flippase FtsW [Aliikangiella marina]